MFLEPILLNNPVHGWEFLILTRFVQLALHLAPTPTVQLRLPQVYSPPQYLSSQGMQANWIHVLTNCRLISRFSPDMEVVQFSGASDTAHFPTAL